LEQISGFFKGILFRTGTAKAVKNSPTEIHTKKVPVSPTPLPEGQKFLIQKGFKCFGVRAGEIRHPAAMAAHQMGMGFYVAVKPFLAVNDAKGGH
jgi:kynurenine formamidase